MYVHDLGLFVTVQLLEETPAFLTLGKLCKEHEYSYQWVSGQQRRLTKKGKKIICETDNFVHLVVPKLSSSTSTSSSSTSSDSERPTKVVSKSRKRKIFTHFPKDGNCEV